MEIQSAGASRVPGECRVGVGTGRPDLSAQESAEDSVTPDAGSDGPAVPWNRSASADEPAELPRSRSQPELWQSGWQEGQGSERSRGWPPWRVEASKRRQSLHSFQAALATGGTKRRVDAGELQDQILPGQLGREQGFRHRPVLKKLSTQSEGLLPMAIGQEAVVADAYKTIGQDVEQKAADEFLG